MLKLPDLSEKTNKVQDYLKARGIHPGIIDYCIKNKYILETDKYHNVVFAGYDENGKMRYANLRGTISGFKGEALGSN